MTTWINVVRYHLLDRISYLVVPWCALAFSLAINLVIFAVVESQGGDVHQTWGLATIYVFVFMGGLVTMTRSLPFGLMLGLSRRSYYLGTALLALTLGAVDGLALTVLQVVERATGGWGEQLHFFRVGWILDGPWYVTWLSSFVALTLLFGYGIWFGLVYRRWNLIGLLAFSAGQVSVLVAVAVVATWTHAWTGIGHFFSALSAVGLTGVLALLAAALLAGGFTTMRRVTI
jgi:hypothetical protein